MRPLLAGLLAVVLLTGCGGEDAGRSTYCDALRGKQETFGDMARSNDPTVLIKRLPTLEGLGEKAPDDLADEWQVFLNALRDLRTALKSEDKKTIKDAADQLSSEEVVAAANGIETQARDVCHLQLGL